MQATMDGFPDDRRERLEGAVRAHQPVLPATGQINQPDPTPPPTSIRLRRLWLEWFLTAAVATTLLVTLLATGATTQIDNALYDFSIRLRHQTPRQDIVIVAIDPKSLQAVGEWPWPRPELAKLIKGITSGNPKALACHFLFLFPAKNADDDVQVRNAMALGRTFLGIPRRTTSHGRTASIIKPIPVIRDAATGFGAGDSQADVDGIVRRTELFEGPFGNRVPRMALQMARLEGRGPDISKRAVGSAERLIPFVGPPNSFRTVPALSVLEGDIPAAFFRNKFVLLGATAPDLLDNYPTPRSTADGMPSVEVDANILNALLTGTRILQASRLGDLMVSMSLLWILLIALVRLDPRQNLWLAVGLVGSPLAATILGVMVFGFWIPPVSYVVTVALIVPYWGWRRLNAASAYFADELRTLAAQAPEAAIDPRRTVATVGGDVVLQQMLLVEDTRKRISDLRQFVADILANFPDPVLVVDRAGRILTVNQAAAIFAERIGASSAVNARIEPILSGLAIPGIEARTVWPPAEPAEGDHSAPAAAPLTGDDPLGLSYEVRFTPTRSAANEATGWIVHLADITPLVSAMRQREEALQLLSHDMRSPLSAILAILDHSELRNIPDKMRQNISAQAMRTLALADDFVRLAKAESGQYVREPIDFAHVLQDAADLVWPLANAGNVTISVELGPDDVEYVTLADRGLLTRALVNLLDNAIKFSTAGQKVVCRLSFTSLRGAPAVACEIADTAGGMTQSKLATLFRKFSSGRNASRGPAGVGLGLALVHAVVTRHDGIIVCESTEGEGTTFTLTLLLDEAFLVPLNAPS